MVLLPSIQAAFPASACVHCSLVLYTTYSMESHGKHSVLERAWQLPAPSWSCSLYNITHDTLLRLITTFCHLNM